MTTAVVPIQSVNEATESFTMSLRLLNGYASRIDFDDTFAPLQTDEPPPLGKGNGPAPSRLLAAAVMNCLASSLLYCLRKSRVDVKEMRASVVGTLGRNERGRLRIDSFDVSLEPGVAPEQLDRMSRCESLFEDYCVVTESVRRGIDVRVRIGPSKREAP
jgi:uncharacterized OsmC-like protein